MHQRERLFQWRVSQQLSQEAAGKKLAEFLPKPSKGVHQGTWGAWETGLKSPDLTRAVAIEKLTDGVVKAEGWAKKRRKPRRYVRSKKAA